MKCLWLASLFVLSFNAFAQGSDPAQSVQPTMILTGAIYDHFGSVIVDQTRVVAYGAGGKSYHAATNEEGIYKFDLPLGNYKVEASAPGFCPAQVERFRVVNSTHGRMSLDFVLEVASGQEGCRHEFTIKHRSKRRARKKSGIIILE
jgi:hypothetical protein